MDPKARWMRMRMRAAWLPALLIAGLAAPPVLPPAVAATIYRCTGPHHEQVFQDTPCAEPGASSILVIRDLPLIDPATPHATGALPTKAGPRSGALRQRTPRAAGMSERSWECRAANGEVFYRHARCPGSVPGDGVVRVDYAERRATEKPGRRETAWAPVPVRGTAVPRAEACHLIHAAGAAGRDGHLRDDHGSAYERAMGRDPCSR